MCAVPPLPHLEHSFVSTRVVDAMTIILPDSKNLFVRAPIGGHWHVGRYLSLIVVVHGRVKLASRSCFEWWLCEAVDRCSSMWFPHTSVCAILCRGGVRGCIAIQNLLTTFQQASLQFRKLSKVHIDIQLGIRCTRYLGCSASYYYSLISGNQTCHQPIALWTSFEWFPWVQRPLVLRIKETI